MGAWPHPAARHLFAPGPEAAGPIRYLHIGKTAGTQIRHLIERVNARAGRELMRRERHRVTLDDIPRDARYFFSVRRPVGRFVSGFYSRKRKGLPRVHSPWSEAEAWAFARFDHANDLAEALFAPGDDGRRALAAIKSIQHTYRNQVDWLDQHGAALFVRPPVWIVRQQHFAGDVETLLHRLGLDGAGAFAASPDARHANDYAGTPPLSGRARANLERWYAQDIAFYDACETWLASTHDAANRAAAPA